MNEMQGILKPAENAGPYNGKVKVFKAVTGDNSDNTSGLCPNNDCGAGVWTIHPARSSMESTYMTTNNLQLKDLATNTWTDAFGYTQAKKVACENTIYTPQAAGWARMRDTSPVKLVEPFFVCSTTFQQALSDSLGNAAGTAQLYMTFFMLFVVLIFKRFTNWFRSKDQHLRHPRVQSIYDDEQQEIQQAKLAKAFKKLLELGKFDVEELAFKDFLEDYESRMDNHHFNLDLDRFGNATAPAQQAAKVSCKAMELEDI